MHCAVGDTGILALYIELRTTDGRLSGLSAPYIWLSNGSEKKGGGSLNLTQAVRSYLPPWELRPGFHVEAEARLITRRLIKSSMRRDILLSAYPTYDYLSLHSIYNLGTSNCNGTDVASARILARLRPGFAYFRDCVVPPYHWQASGDTCDIIEDYRSGTVLDVIGLVGGLFALLQAICMVLFGRPLLWGLTGAKLITPFGILGAFGSRTFERRLRDYYHRRSTKDGSVKIRTTQFLQDFVIDFGPVDINTEQHPSQHLVPPSPTLMDNKEEHNFSIPLIQMGSNFTFQSVF